MFFIKHKKRNLIIICNAFSLTPPPRQPSIPQAVPPETKTAAEVAAKGLRALIFYPTAIYVVGIAGQIVPEFHSKFIKEGLKPVSLYVLQAITKGDFNPESVLMQISFSFAPTTFGLLNPQQKKLASLDFEFSTEAKNNLLQSLNFRGGGSEIAWLSLFTKIYFLYLLCLFFFVYIPTFLSLLDKEFQKNPQLSTEFYYFYLYHFAPIGYKINKNNYIITCSTITDDFFELNLE